MKPSVQSGRLLRWLAVWLVLFVAGLLAYNASYGVTRGILVHQLQVRPAAWMLGKTLPGVSITAREDAVVSPQLTLELRRGCDGIEAWLLMVTALLAYPGTWRWRARSALWGTLLIYLLNLLRVVSIFHLVRHRPEWFDLVHGLIWQGLMILAACCFVLVRLDQTGTPPESPA